MEIFIKQNDKHKPTHMTAINNRKRILLYQFLYASILFMPLTVLLYLNHNEFFIICAALFIFLSSIKFFFSKYSEVKMYSDHIVIKVYSIAGRAPLHFSPIAFIDIQSFYIDEKERKIVFRTEFEMNTKMTSYSTRYFTKEQVLKLRTVLKQRVKENVQVLSA